MSWLRKIWTSLRMWWRAEMVIEEGRLTARVVAFQPGTYVVDVDGRQVGYKTKWYDTKRSVARKLGRMVRR